MDHNTPLTHKQKQENRVVDRVMAAITPLLGQQHVVGVPQQELNRFLRFMRQIRVLSASALLAAVLGAIYEYLTLVGVTDMQPARVVLMGAGLFGLIFVFDVLATYEIPLKKSLLIGGGIGAVFIAGLFGLDHWAVQWKTSHPLDSAKFADEVGGLTRTVSKLISTQPAQGVSPPKVTEIKPVPGYLAREMFYTRYPLEEVGKAIDFDVYYVNKGSSYTHDSTMKANLFWVDGHGMKLSPLHDENGEKQLEDQLRSLPPQGYSDIAPGAAIFNTLQTIVFTKEMIDAMQAGTSRVYFVALVDWKTNGVPDHEYSCEWLQPSTWGRQDAKNKVPVWHIC